MTADASSRWLPLEDLVPAEVFKAEVRAWARQVGVEPKEIHYPTDETEVGELLVSGALDV